MDSFKNLFWIHYNIASVLCSDFWPWGMWDLSSSIRYWICTPCIRRWSLNHWSIRKVYSCRVSELMFYTTLILCNLSTIELSSNNSGKFGVKKVQREYFLQYSQSVMEKAMATHSSTLAWKIPWTEEPGRLQSMGSLRVGHNWATSLSLFTFLHWRRKWQPTAVFLPGESQGRGSLVGCRLWGLTESERLKRLSSSSSRVCYAQVHHHVPKVG